MTLPSDASTRAFGRIEREIQESADLKSNLCGGVIDAIAQMAQIIIQCLKGKNQLIIFGNGGSATDAEGTAALFRHPPAGRPV